MTRARISILFAALVLVGMGCADFFSSKSCTLLGCRDQVTAVMAVGQPVTDLHEGRVRVCRETDCSEARLEAEQDAGRKTGVVSCRSPRFECPFFPGSVPTELRVTFTDFVNAPPRDGETFEVTVFSPTGATVASRSGSVQYRRQRPNGPDCERSAPTPS